MGSVSSGNRLPRLNKRPLVTSATRADVCRMWELGLLTPHAPNVGALSLDWMPVALGGFRPWFLCPQCRGRCRYLYIVGNVWGCRRCSGLGYLSERLSGGDRLQYFHKVQKPLFYKRMKAPVQMSAKGHPIIPPRPEGMDESVYNTLVSDFVGQYSKALEWYIQRADALMGSAMALLPN